MSIIVELDRIMSFGHLVSRDYQLVCHGYLAERKDIMLSPIFNHSQPLNRPTPFIHNPSSSIVISSPLSTYTSLKIIINTKQKSWEQSLEIDLKKWTFSLQPFDSASLSLPIDIAIFILSSFGIQKKSGEVMSLATLSSKRSYAAVNIRKRMDREEEW